MDNDSSLRIFAPESALSRLSVPAMAITDGSANPEWVVVPSKGRYRYSRTPNLRLPFDPITATAVRRWEKYRRLNKVCLTPIGIILILAGLVVRSLPYASDGLIFTTALLLCIIGFAVVLSSGHLVSRLEIRQIPIYTRKVGVHIDGIPSEVASEWANLNHTLRISQRITE